MPTRGKTKQQKYTEAVERNLRNAKKVKYQNKKLDVAKRMLGIRQDDSKYDSDVRHLIGGEFDAE